MIKRIFLVLIAIITFASSGYSQLKSGDWNIYPVFNETPMNVVESAKYVYYVADNSLFRYDKATATTANLTKRSGINDNFVTQIHYDYRLDNVVVVYSTSNIDIIASDGSVTNIPCIADTRMASNRTVNDVTFSNDGMMYVATDFGYLVYDLQSKAVTETNIYYTKVNSVARIGASIVISTDSGLFTSPLTADHSTAGSFTSIASDQKGKIVPATDNALFVSRSDATMYVTLDGTTATSKKIITLSNAIMNASTEGVVISTLKGSNIAIASYDGNATIVPCSKAIISNRAADGTVWKITTDGLAQARIADNALVALTEPVKPNATIMKRVGNLLYLDATDKLYVMTCGANNLNEKYGLRGNINTLQNGVIELATPAEIPTYNTGADQNKFQDLYSPVIDPIDPETFYIGTRFEGVFRMKGNEITGKFDWNNSLLVLNWHCFANGIAFDNDNNMWVQGLTKDKCQLIVLPADKLHKENLTAEDWIRPNVNLPSNSSWRSLFMISHKHNMKISNNGSYASITTVIDDGGNPASENVRSKQFASFSDQNGIQFKPTWFYALKEDSKGNVWLCTAGGVFYFDPSKAFDDDFRGTRPTLSDGSTLLESIDVTSMCEDAQGHYWFGTATQGLYEVSADCKQILNHFTTDNSLLPDNKVLAVLAKPNGSNIYIGTESGLCEFVRGITPGETDYSRVTITPSNVPQGFTGFVSIEKLISGSSVKITDAKGAVVATIAADGGTAIWDVTDAAGKRVPTGRYTITATAANVGESTTVGHVNVIR
ncbi:MAG: two-component regulator propeller domain-containing protein [Muribaculaceae bacterium]